MGTHVAHAYIDYTYEKGAGGRGGGEAGEGCTCS